MEEKLRGGFVFGWKVIAYLFLAGVGGGAAAVGAAIHLILPEAEIITRTSVILGAPLVVVGCILLFFDLGASPGGLSGPVAAEPGLDCERDNHPDCFHRF